MKPDQSPTEIHIPAPNLILSTCHAIGPCLSDYGVSQAGDLLQVSTNGEDISQSTFFNTLGRWQKLATDRGLEGPLIDVMRVFLLTNTYA